MNLYFVKIEVKKLKFGEFTDFIVAASNQKEAEDRVKEYTNREIKSSIIVNEGAYIVGDVYLKTKNV